MRVLPLKCGKRRNGVRSLSTTISSNRRRQFSQPQTLRALTGVMRKQCREVTTRALHEVAGPNHVKTSSDREHRLDNVLLVPAARPEGDQVGRVIIRQKYIVNLNEYAYSYARHYR